MNPVSAANVLSRDEIASAIRALSVADWIRLRKVADRYSRGRIEANDLLQEAFARALDTRTCPAHVSIRLVESEHTPSLVICHMQGGRKWFSRSPSVSDRWFPRDTLDAESYAFNILFGTAKDNSQPRKIGADAWFDRWDAEKYELTEQSIRIRANEILTLIQITDGRMLD